MFAYGTHTNCISTVQVISDAVTGRSKGYGFVRFTSLTERDKALVEMNGHFLSNRPIRVSLATAKRHSGSTTSSGGSSQQMSHPSDFDPTNTTLFIGGLSPVITEDQLRALFNRFGDIIYVKIPQGKGCGFVQFVLRTSAENAMAAMQSQVLGNSAIRISWGRSSSRANSQAAFAHLSASGHANPPAAAAAVSVAPGGVPGHFPQGSSKGGGGGGGLAQALYADPALLAAAAAGGGFAANKFGPMAPQMDGYMVPASNAGNPMAAIYNSMAAAGIYSGGAGAGGMPLASDAAGLVHPPSYLPNMSDLGSGDFSHGEHNQAMPFIPHQEREAAAGIDGVGPLASPQRQFGSPSSIPTAKPYVPPVNTSSSNDASDFTAIASQNPGMNSSGLSDSNASGMALVGGLNPVNSIDSTARPRHGSGGVPRNVRDAYASETVAASLQRQLSLSISSVSAGTGSAGPKGSGSLSEQLASSIVVPGTSTSLDSTSMLEHGIDAERDHQGHVKRDDSVQNIEYKRKSETSMELESRERSRNGTTNESGTERDREKMVLTNGILDRASTMEESNATSISNMGSLENTASRTLHGREKGGEE